MKKKLSEMSLEELWQLFPIFLVEHKPYWKDWYTEEENELKKILPPKEIVHINHIGSTAITGIWAKPIIDILVEISCNSDMHAIEELLLQNGFLVMSHGDGRVSLNKGYSEDGFEEKVFHLHLRYEGDNDEIYFRDYLNENPAIAKQYEELKLNLWEKYKFNRDGYTDAKTEFILKYTILARKNK